MGVVDEGADDGVDGHLPTARGRRRARVRRQPWRRRLGAARGGEERLGKGENEASGELGFVERGRRGCVGRGGVVDARHGAMV